MKAGEEIPFMLVRPFGPFIVKSELPQELMDDYNEELEKIVKDKKKIKELDWSPHLVGKVKHELRVPENLRKKYDGYFEALVDAYVKKVTDNPEGRPFKLGTAWYVRQFQNDFNPIHIHTYCSLSSVGYLKLPKGIEKEFKSEENKRQGRPELVPFCHNTDNEIKILSWLHQSKTIDATLCMLRDETEPILECKGMKPSAIIIDKLKKEFGKIKI